MPALHTLGGPQMRLFAFRWLTQKFGWLSVEKERFDAKENENL